MKNQIENLKKSFLKKEKSLSVILKELDNLYNNFFIKNLKQIDNLSFAFLITGSGARKELSFYSDIDILILTNEDSENEHIQNIINKIIYPLWDLKISVGYSIRTIKEFIEFANNDIIEWTKIIDCRFVYGNTAIYNDFKKQVKRALFNRDKINRNLKELFYLNDNRREKAGKIVYNLEPDIKNNPGTLRDLHLIRWYLKLFRDSNILKESEIKNLKKANKFFLHIRNILHAKLSKNVDSLTFENQEKVAQYFYPEKSNKLELLMNKFYFYANIVDYAYEYLRERFFSTFLIDKMYNKKIDEYFFIENFRLCMNDYHIIEHNPELMLKAFYFSQKYQIFLSYELREAIKQNVKKINANFRKDKKNIKLFFNILEKGSPLASTLRLMNQLNFLQYFIPEFKKIKFKITYDLYHKFTVDVHSLLAVQELRNLFNGYYIAEYPFISALSLNIPNKKYLLLVALIHDIGKGVKGEKSHLEKGEVLAEKIAERMEIEKKYIEIIKFLVRNHTLMTNTALRRDIKNEDEIINFAKKVKNEKLLNYLFLISFADLRAVSPDSMDKWKYSLLQELYIKTFSILKRKNFIGETIQEKLAKIKTFILENIPQKEEIQFTKFINHLSRRLVSNFSPQDILRLYHIVKERKELPFVEVRFNKERDTFEILTLFYNYTGIFNKIVGILTLSNCNIISGEIYTNKDGTIIDIFEVKPVFEILDIEEFSLKLNEKMREILNYKGENKEFETQLNNKILTYCKKTIYNIIPIVKFNNKDNDFFTILEIIAEDFMGLLYKITKILSKRGIEIHSSKITTQGVKAIDTFYITTIEGDKILDKKLQDKVSEEIIETLNEFQKF